MKIALYRVQLNNEKRLLLQFQRIVQSLPVSCEVACCELWLHVVGSLRSRRKRERGRGARTREKNGVLGARDEGTPATKTPIFSSPPTDF